MQEELKVLLKIKALYEKQVAEIKAKASQQKLEEAVPELKEVAEEADKVHETAMIGALPSGEPDESASS
jgi:DNA gyrase inhibitor GyrI